MTKFLRRNWSRHAKFRRKKKNVWRKPRGRDNKMREKKKGYPQIVSIGHRKNNNSKKKLIVIKNLSDLNKIKNKTVILGKIGKKKKIEIAKMAENQKINILNLNTKKFLKKHETFKKQVEKK